MQGMTVKLHISTHRVGTAHTSTRESQQTSQNRWGRGRVVKFQPHLRSCWQMTATGRGSWFSSGIRTLRGYLHSSRWSHSHAHAGTTKLIRWALHLKHLGFVLGTLEEGTGKGTWSWKGDRVCSQGWYHLSFLACNSSNSRTLSQVLLRAPEQKWRAVLSGILTVVPSGISFMLCWEEFLSDNRVQSQGFITSFGPSLYFPRPVCLASHN